jgi:hypothetical protein
MTAAKGDIAGKEGPSSQKGEGYRERHRREQHVASLDCRIAEPGRSAK